MSKDTKTRKYIFSNLEEPGCGHFFRFGSMRSGMWETVLLHGAQVDLTQEQHDFIMEGCVYPEHDYINDPTTGKLTPKQTTVINRFSLRLVA